MKIQEHCASSQQAKEEFEEQKRVLNFQAQSRPARYYRGKGRRERTCSKLTQRGPSSHDKLFYLSLSLPLILVICSIFMFLRIYGIYRNSFTLVSQSLLLFLLLYFCSKTLRSMLKAAYTDPGVKLSQFYEQNSFQLQSN